MKKASLFACLLVLSLGASAQSRQSVGATSVGSNAHGGEPPVAVRGVNRIPPNVGPQAATATAQQPTTTVPPTAKVPPTAVKGKK